MARKRKTPATNGIGQSAVTDSIAALIQTAQAAERRADYVAALKAYEQAGEQLTNTPNDTRRADVLRFMGTVYRERGEAERADSFFHQSLATAEGLGYASGVAHALSSL